MATGTVKFFNSTKGFGFIQPDSGGADVFVHISALERAGLSELAVGQKIDYEVAQDRRNGKAVVERVAVGAEAWIGRVGRSGEVAGPAAEGRLGSAREAANDEQMRTAIELSLAAAEAAAQGLDASLRRARTGLNKLAAMSGPADTKAN